MCSKIIVQQPATYTQNGSMSKTVSKRFEILRKPASALTKTPGFSRPFKRGTASFGCPKNCRHFIGNGRATQNVRCGLAARAGIL